MGGTDRQAKVIRRTDGGHGGEFGGRAAFFQPYWNGRLFRNIGFSVVADSALRNRRDVPGRGKTGPKAGSNPGCSG